jgi:hypothetical protein
MFITRCKKDRANLQSYTFLILCLLLAQGFWATSRSYERFVCFDVNDVGEQNNGFERIEPWKVVHLDPAYGGQWVAAGDVDGNGQVEIVSAENVNKDDIHYTSTAVAQKLDGTVLWRWGNPDIGRKMWHHDVACQIYDWDGDGKQEVILCTKDYLVELDGSSGQERRRIKINEEATDCLVFCNLSGGKHPGDVLVKTRYGQIWAYDYGGKLLWTVKEPAGYHTAHQPRPIDIDGDGRDEIMAGYALLNPDGTLRWVFQSEKVKQKVGHLDCCRVVREGKKPEDFRLVLTCCGANNIAMVDGTGKTLWEVSGHHFESVDVGKVIPDYPGEQLVVDIDHQPFGNGPLWVLDEQGKLLGRIVTNYSRHHCLLDWTGDGIDEILVGDNGAVYNYQGKRIVVLSAPKAGEDEAEGEKVAERSILAGDMNGDKICDVLLVTTKAVYIFRNEKGQRSREPLPPGTEHNLTLY